MQTATVAGKQVFLPNPYAPSRAPLVGRDRELRLVSAAWMGDGVMPPMHPLLCSRPGNGKNHIAAAAAANRGAELYVATGHEDMSVEDLVCGARVTDERSIEFVASPLTTALLRGGVFLLDEIGKLRPRVLASLASLLDERRSIDSLLLGARIEAAPGFRFIAATNSEDIPSIPEFIRSRLLIVRVTPPSREELLAIVTARYGDRFRDQRQAFVDPLLACFWESWGRERPDDLPSARDVISIFDLAARLSDMGGYDECVSANERPVPIAPSGLCEAIEEFFRLDREAR